MLYPSDTEDNHQAIESNASVQAIPNEQSRMLELRALMLRHASNVDCHKEDREGAETELD
ncbi:hypothetical protein VN12_14000 [Pirellula sp. SH-Sr6A]|uniref:hypothetical protein n=1 Tax=Pirellula sp. SH-Sr6A TaxID=1632865 RepID=UPI00078E4A74|nr:hypothetical protein [Pirellula sp. SH-Sr6A]AMV33235.1 hypothetical protein VN12_14000 [Pirellula sp. SH-Sr6A]